MRDIQAVIKILADFMGEMGIRYAFVGGVAASAWGEPRGTTDIDIILLIEPDAIENFVKFLRESHFKTSVADIEAALEEKSHFSIFDDLSDYWLDVKGVYSWMDEETLAHRKKIRVMDVSAYIASAEDTVANKLRFGSPRDIEDAKKIILRRKGKLDMKRLRALAKKMGVTGKLNYLLG